MLFVGITPSVAQEFPLPGTEEREKLFQLYRLENGSELKNHNIKISSFQNRHYQKYIADTESSQSATILPEGFEHDEDVFKRIALSV